jgi:ribosomal-protein-alanine N-acetyltransferase
MLELHFTPFPYLRTERLNLRNVVLEDANEIFVQRTHPVIQEYIKRQPAANIEEARQFIGKINAHEKNNEAITWAIVPKDESRLIGTICFWNIEKQNDKAELGYSLHPDYFGKGIMSEALAEIINFGFNEMKLQTIDAYTNKDNAPSLRLLKRLGFSRNIAFEKEFVDQEELEYNVVYTLNRV